MYNLLVTWSDETWDESPYYLETERCIRKYTDDKITAKFGELNKEQVEQIKCYPCIFAYEERLQKNPKFGIIKNITSTADKVKIEYELIELSQFITHHDLNNTSELGIVNREMNLTHWAIKDIDLPKKLLSKKIHLPDYTRIHTANVDISKHVFDVAFSFPGEVREYVQSIASEIERELGANTYFYDNNYKSQLARPALDILLQDIYRSRSRLIVVFLCEKYQDKEWCGIEFRSISEILMEKEYGKIMYVKMDDGKVDGVAKNDGYIDSRHHSPKEIAIFIQQRLLLLP